MKSQYGFYLDADTCTGCNTCAIACKDKNNLPRGVFWRRVYEIEGGSYGKKGSAFSPTIYAFFVTMSCNHCQNPACVTACTFEALEKRDMDGLVVVNTEKCKGCRRCINACPYGSLHINGDNGKISKCDGCFNLQNQGEAPECISACPMRAVEFGPMEELKGKHPDAVLLNLIIPKDKCTLPSFLVKSHRCELVMDNLKGEGIK